MSSCKIDFPCRKNKTTFSAALFEWSYMNTVRSLFFKTKKGKGWYELYHLNHRAYLSHKPENIRKPPSEIMVLATITNPGETARVTDNISS